MLPTTAPQLVDELLDRLTEEEALLRDALASLADLHSALCRGELEAINAIRPRQEAVAAALTDRAGVRSAAAAALAAAVGLAPGGLTLSALAARLPGPTGAGLLAARDRLASVAAEVGNFQRRNANLITYLRSYFRCVLSVLAVGDAPVRYGPTGTCLSPTAGATIRTRG